MCNAFPRARSASGIRNAPSEAGGECHEKYNKNEEFIIDLAF